MRTEMNDDQVQAVVGGTVIISYDYNKIGFSTLGKKFSLKNVTPRAARDYVDDLMDANPGLSNAEFDQLCYQKMSAKGWI